MANLNLSQFGENTSVSDADYTFVWDSAASISKKVSRNSWLNSGELTSSAPVTISQTWNQIGTAFTAFKVNAVSTASASGSLLADFQVGGVSQVNINKDGRLLITTQGGASTPSILIGGGGAGFYQPTNTQISFASNSSEAIRFTGSGIRLGLNELGFGPAYNSNDTILLRDGAANTLALRNGAGVPQTFRVYNTFLGTTANEWFEIDWKVSAGTVRLFTMHGGTGVARNIDISAGATLFFGAGSGSPIKMYSGNVERWNISATGHFIAAADNSYDIGASGANRPRNLYVGSNMYASGNVGIGTTSPTSKLHVAGDVTLPNGGSIFFGGGFNIYGTTTSTTINGPTAFGILNVASNGVTKWTFNYDGLLCGGGTTAAFPALKRSSTTMQARLADDTAFAPIQGKLTTDTAFTATTVVPTGFITLYDSTGTAYKVPCVPA